MSEHCSELPGTSVLAPNKRTGSSRLLIETHALLQPQLVMGSFCNTGSCTRDGRAVMLRALPTG